MSTMRFFWIRFWGKQTKKLVLFTVTVCNCSTVLFLNSLFREKMRSLCTDCDKKKQGKKCSNEKFRRRLKLDQVKVLGKCYLYEYVSSFLRASTDVKHSPSVSHVSCGQISQWHFNRPAIESTTCLPINLRYGS